MDWAALLTVGLPRAYAEIVLGNWHGLEDPAPRMVLGVSLAGMIAGIVWACWRREAHVAWFLAPLILTHLLPLGFGLLYGLAPTGTDFLVAFVLYVVVEIALVALAITYSAKARMAAALIGWFCLSYGALPIYYTVLALGSI